MRTLDATYAAMIAKYDEEYQTPARCLYLATRDGTVLGVTDHDEDLIIDMPDISDVPVTFYADSGILPSDVQTSIGYEADSFEVTGPYGLLFPRVDVLGRRFARARARLFEIDWSDPSPVPAPILQGFVTNQRIFSNRFVIEVRSDMDRYNVVIGDVISPWCNAMFGDVRCGAAVPAVACTVTHVLNDFQFRVDVAGSYGNDHFVYGKADFTSGGLANADPVEVWSYVGATGYVTTLVPFPEEPQVGDSLVLKRGCSKLKKSDSATIPTCTTYSNQRRFRGLDWVPGTDQYVRMPVAGEA